MAKGVAVNSGNGSNILTVNGSAALGTIIKWFNQASGAAYNWQVGTNLTNGTSLEFQPSTALDGNTFTTSVMKISNAGNLTLLLEREVFSGAGNSSFVGNVGIGTTGPTVKARCCPNYLFKSQL